MIDIWTRYSIISDVSLVLSGVLIKTIL